MPYKIKFYRALLFGFKPGLNSIKRVFPVKVINDIKKPEPLSINPVQFLMIPFMPFVSDPMVGLPEANVSVLISKRCQDFLNRCIVFWFCLVTVG